jgi:reverse transcriptase-like protein
MFFGLTNSPATFQTMMDNIFQEEITQGWLKIYMDNLIVASEENEVVYQQQVDHILQKIKDHDLFLKAKKCSFHKKQVKYLSIIIGQGKVEMDPVKVEGIAKWPVPMTVKDICSFLGFCNFYHSFIANFSTVARPLNDLMKKQ